MDNILIDFLKSFFLLFNAEIIRFEVSGDDITGAVGWVDEEDQQDFSLSFSPHNASYINAKLLCDYLNFNNLVNGDSIIISEPELKLKLSNSGWSNSNVEDAINFLFSFEVKMFDDDKESDSFFLHF
jgi:hypothetical protein